MVGVLTLHYGYNEGAILQAYALAQLLGAHIDGDVRIIDHRYPRKVRIYSQSMDARKEALKVAVDTWLPLSRDQFVTERASRTWKWISGNCTGLVVGSDQVWRLCYRRTFFGLACRQPDAFVGRFPNVYWPPAWVRVPRCAYAASIGDQLTARPPRRHLLRMRRVLEGFSVIGVRDERTATFVEDVAPACANRLRLCPDPTIVIPWQCEGAQSSLVAKAERVGLSLSRPFCLLAMDMCNYTRELAGRIRSAGWLVVGYGSGESYSDISFAKVGITPLEWISLIGSASLCITDRYHAFIFSVLQGRPCLVFDRAKKRLVGSPTRISSLAQSIGYGQYVLDIGSPVEDVVKMAQSIGPDWGRVGAGLQKLRRIGGRVIVEIAQALKE